MLHNIIFSNNLFVICVLLGLFFSFLLYFNERKNLKSSILYSLTIFRFILITLLSFLLLDPVVKSENKITEQPIVVILQDGSSSIQQNIFKQLNDLSKKLSGYDVYNYNFSDKLYSDFTSENNGLITDFSKALGQVKSIFSNRNLSSIVLASDGLNNTGLNPLFSDNLEVPIHTICLGDTNIYSDNFISDVKHNDIVFLGNSFQSEIYIESKKYIGNSINLTVENNGKILFQDEIIITSNNQFFKIPVEIPTSEVGVQSFIVKISPISNERNINNNSFRFYVDVINTKYNILLVHDDTHPDLGSYVNVINRNKDYKLDVISSKDLIQDLSSYSLIVIHSISNENDDFINKIKENGNIPLLIFCKQDFNLYSEIVPNVNFRSKSTNSDVYSSVNIDFLSFKLSNSLVNFIEKAPPISTNFGLYNISSSVNLLLNQKIGNTISDSPICLFDEYNGQKIGVLFGEGFWRWKLKDFRINNNNDLFNEFYNKITQFLLLKEDKSKFRLLYDTEINENQKLIFNAQVYNDNFQLENNEDVRLVLTNSKNQEFEYLFDKVDDKYFLDVGRLDADNYSLYAKVDKRNYEKYGDINVKSIQIEKISNVADHQFLYNLSNDSGGKSFSFSDLFLLEEYLNKNQNKTTLTTIEDKLKQLIDFELILLILLLLISTEWFVRKYHGLT